MTCAMKTEDALMSSSWLVCIFPEGALDLCGKEVAATRRGKKQKRRGPFPSALTRFPVIISGCDCAKCTHQQCQAHMMPKMEPQDGVFDTV